MLQQILEFIFCIRIFNVFCYEHGLKEALNTQSKEEVIRWVDEIKTMQRLGLFMSLVVEVFAMTFAIKNTEILTVILGGWSVVAFFTSASSYLFAGSLKLKMHKHFLILNGKL